MNQPASPKSPGSPAEFSESDIRAFEAREGIKLREIHSDHVSKDYSEQENMIRGDDDDEEQDKV